MEFTVHPRVVTAKGWLCSSSKPAVTSRSSRVATPNRISFGNSGRKNDTSRLVRLGIIRHERLKSQGVVTRAKAGDVSTSAADGDKNPQTVEATILDESALAPYPDKLNYVTYSLDEGLSYDEGEENHLSTRLQKAIEDEQELEEEQKKLTAKLSKAKYAREGLEQQMKAEVAATETMNRAFALRRDREKRIAASFSELERESKELSAVVKAPAKERPKSSNPARNRRGLKNFMRTRSAKRRNAMAAASATARQVKEAKQASVTEPNVSSLPEAGMPLVTPFEDSICATPKPIYVVSDCTGESAANTVRCALGQFELCMDESVPTNLMIFRFVSKEREVYEIFTRAAEMNALVVTSLVEERVKRASKVAANTLKVRVVDLWSDLLDNMESHLELIRSGIPLGKSDHHVKLSADYFRMIEAVEYTRKQDDGAMPENWFEADILLLGVSRTGKTPLAIYLGQRGYKVANLPLVPINGKFHIPKQLYEIDQDKIIGLLINPELLLSVRSSRMDAMGVRKSSPSSRDTYDSLVQCRKEVEHAKVLYAKNPSWPVLDVTYRAVEETAARVLRIMSDRQGPMHPRDVEKCGSLKDVVIPPEELAAFEAATGKIVEQDFY
mmetsp:Transcript_38209/g.83095  ORF Transcript_38209/g.83095 Transcript_38209/m.83095 type:complete len:613 (-) Transcript_38209:40-1878(-)|eukprot:CAMPEP_0118936726 /NCGR_PEP_ID=MMETSP1169-20130426/20180_1 /TAXON_ID=36882 /ORGANISM="Pyramimonas obovata, Strain CCMP722" /LENGTH=612 /DNA_ID=CAMNT_0006880089 /DNA_START=62 /DNA_END=1900 /DNA_ORIENTATION=-